MTVLITLTIATLAIYSLAIVPACFAPVFFSPPVTECPRCGEIALERVATNPEFAEYECSACGHYEASGWIS